MAETPAVDDIWKAAAYGDLDKTKEYLEHEPENVNKPDATGCVFAISSPRDPRDPPRLRSNDASRR
jgi:hypothetical protein